MHCNQKTTPVIFLFLMKNGSLILVCWNSIATNEKKLRFLLKKMGNETVARVIVGVLKRSHFSENWAKNVSFSWKMTQIGLIFMKNEAKRYNFCEKWTKKVPFLWKMSQKVSFSGKNEPKRSHFCEKWLEKVSFSWKKMNNKTKFWSVQLGLVFGLKFKGAG